MKVPFLDLRVDDDERRELLAAVDAVLKHGRILLGPEVEMLERAIADRVRRKHCIGVGSGTDALILTLRALGIGPGDEVIVPPLSFVATANAVALVGAEPVFADVGDDLCLDPAGIDALAGPRTKAVIAVHWAGRICRMEEIAAAALRHGLTVIEDAAQAFDAERHGLKAGAFGSVACFSMNSMKVFASLGEAGAIVTDDDALAARLNRLRYHGLENRETCVELSHNGRIDTLQAAMLLIRLHHLDRAIERRRDNAAFYNSQLADLVEVPVEAPGCRDVFYTYTIRCDRRDFLKRSLEEMGIETKIQHLPLMPDQPVHSTRRGLGHSRARQMMERTLCLPVSEKLTDAERRHVALSVRTILSGTAR